MTLSITAAFTSVQITVTTEVTGVETHHSSLGHFPRKKVFLLKFPGKYPPKTLLRLFRKSNCLINLTQQIVADTHFYFVKRAQQMSFAGFSAEISRSCFTHINWAQK